MCTFLGQCVLPSHLPKQGCSVADFWIWYMNFLQQKSSGGTQVSGLLAHVTVVKVWGSGVSSASGMLNMCLTCQLLWMTVNARLPQWYSYFFYSSQSSANSTTSLWPRRYQLGSKVKKDTYIYLDFIWWAHFYGSLWGKKAVIWQHVRVSSPITRRDICQSGQFVLISLSTVAAAGGLAFASYLVYKRCASFAFTSIQDFVYW